MAPSRKPKAEAAPVPSGLGATIAATPGGCRIAVRARPRSRRAAVLGAVPWRSARDDVAADGRGFAIEVAVTAAPVEGAANAAILALLAEILGRPKRSLRITHGETGRVKLVEVDGLDPAAAEARIAAAVADRRGT